MKVIDLHTELNALGIKFANIGFVKAPSYPYGIYLDDRAVRQSDTNVNVRTVEHEITIDVYHVDLSDLHDAAFRVRTWLNEIPINYTERTRYVVDEDHFVTTFTFKYLAKEKE